MEIKICGITNAADAILAVQLGANYVGFILYDKSDRYIPLENVKNICDPLPDTIKKVAVVVNASTQLLDAIINSGLFDILQLHGDETPELCAQLKKRIKIFKAFRLQNEDDIENLDNYDVDGFVLDTFVQNMYGGTGKTSVWQLAKIAKDSSVTPIILSGGLNPQNIINAIKTVRPDIIDVSSGIEKEVGKKDPEKLKEFINKIKALL